MREGTLKEGSIRDHLLASFSILIISWERFQELSQLKSQKVDNWVLYYTVYLRVSYILMIAPYNQRKTKS